VNRAPIILTATVAGVAATLGFNARTAHPAPTPTPKVATTAAPAAASGSPSSSSSTKTVTSDAVATQYGDVQLKVTVAGRKITKIAAAQLPSNDAKSVAIARYAEPLLRQSALAKQSASVDVVSGATYTSEGYQAALQSALDKAGL
jgi:uncharacterized protein with FMN-binding domain